MANGYKTGGKNFPHGNKYGKGFPKFSPEQLEVKRKIDSYHGKYILAKYCLMNFSDLKEKIQDDNVPNIDKMIMVMIERCIEKAELPILMWIYTRLGWDTQLLEQEGEFVPQAKLIIKLDENKNLSHLEAKEK